jgi:hypothetical protein
MGKVAPIERLGEVSMPTPQRPERLGDVSVDPQPIAPGVPAPHVSPEPK